MTILEYRERIKTHAPCKSGFDAFLRCSGRKDVFELLSGPVAADYFLKSVAEGWGPSPEEFEHVFRPYVNGGLTVVNNVGERKIRSQVWCRADDVSVPDSVRWLILVGCRGDVRVGPWQVVKVFLDASCSVRIHCAENSIVYVENYGGEIRGVDGECKIRKVV